mgnify:CR=1 FL=1
MLHLAMLDDVGPECWLPLSLNRPLDCKLESAELHMQLKRTNPKSTITFSGRQFY